MGEEEVKFEASNVVANGVKSPEKVKEDVIDNKEEQNGVKTLEEEGKNEVKVDAKEELDAEKMDEDKEEVKKEKGSKEEELKSETKEDEKGSGEGEQEEDNKDENVDGLEKKIDNVEENNEDIEEVKEKEEGKASKKRRRGNAALDESADIRNTAEEKEQEPKTPIAADRPVRERKSVERLVAVIEKDTSREFHIAKGRGTPLKDIPNVAYKLSRRKGEDTFRLLHTILFGRRGKAAQIKNNISRFSGFVWRDNEEKQKMKVKEKLDKCVKEKLLEICDVLDIPVAKATAKKEDIVAKLLDFLVAPHATTTELLSEKEQSSRGKKRGREGSTPRSRGTSSRRPAKSRKKSNDSKRELKKSASDTEEDTEDDREEGEETEHGLPERSDDENADHSESREKDDASEEESEEGSEKAKQRSKEKSSKKDSAGKEKIKKITTPKRSTPQAKGTPKRSAKPAKVSDNVDASPKVFSRKKKNDGDKEKVSGSKRSASREKPGKRAVKGKGKPKNDKTKPTDDDLRNTICEILKEVDFNTATFTDILKQLAKRFDTDLTPRKAAIKLMIQDELTKLADEADDEEEGEGDAAKEEVKPAEEGVEA